MKLPLRFSLSILANLLLLSCLAAPAVRNPAQASPEHTVPPTQATSALDTPPPAKQAGGAAQIAGCPALPANSIWNTPVDTLPVDSNSSQYIQSIGASTGLHPDFGAGTWDGYPIGIPYNIVNGQDKVSVDFYYPEESDPGPYPIPSNPLIEGGGDHHILIVDQQNCVLYEIYDAWYDGIWHGGSGAIFNLYSNDLRPAGWTSADAAGLPILPGLVRYEEVAAGEINHAIRFTAAETRREYTWPARHYASSITDLGVPPMGQRFRLKASFDIQGFDPQVQIILRAMKKYGLILADNGSDWYISGEPNEAWNNDVLVGQLRQVPGSAFEAVDVSGVMVHPDSGEARLAALHLIWLPTAWR